MQIGENIFNHTNVFGGGMNKDSNILLQPDGTYRHLKNFQLINHDGNNYTIKDSLGNRVIFTLPPPYDASVPNIQDVPMPIGFISFPDKLIVFSTNSESSSGGYGEIGVLFLTNIGQSIEQSPQTIIVGANTWTFNGYVPLYHHVSLSFSKMYKIEGFGFPENDAVARVYWTDNYNQPRVLDTLASVYTTYIATGSLVVGTQYMVLTGAVTHNAIDYGPGLTAGNIFTAVNANYLVADGQPLVIVYYDIELLNFLPAYQLANMNFDSFGSGNCYCGNRMYFYRMKSTSAGYTTSWSYGMFPVHVGLDQDPNLTALNSQHEYVGAGSGSTLENSGKSVKIRVGNTQFSSLINYPIDIKFDTIELACAEFDQAFEVPYAIKIVARSAVAVTDTQIILEDFGNVNLGDLTLDDITLFPASILKCKTITTNKNYNIIGNITERQEFTGFDKSFVTLSEFVYPMGVDGDHSECANAMTYAGNANAVNPSTGANPALVGRIETGTRWLVVSGGTVLYNAVVYQIGEVFVGVLGNKNWAVNTGAPVVRPVVSLNRYDNVNGAARQIKFNAQIQTFTGWDYRNPAVAAHVKSYRSNEKYRFGILFYDKKGNPYYVRHLGDYTFGTLYTKNGLLINQGSGGLDWFNLQPNLLNVSGLRIPRAIVEASSGFSIVRAECDQTIITQGLCWQTQLEAGAPNIIHPLPSLTLNGGNGHAADPVDHVYSFICPDDLVGHSFKKPIGVTGDTIRVAGWLNALSYGGVAYSFYSADDEWYSKIYDHIDATDVNYNNESTITNWSRVNESDYISNYLTGNDFYNADAWIGVSAYNIDDTCAATGSTNADNLIFVGGRKIALRTTADLDNYDRAGAAASPYSDTLNGNGNLGYKCLVNYVKPNGNQYGGNSDNALADTLYISTGHFQPFNTQVITDNNNTNNVNTYTYLTFNNIQVGGGDTFVSMIDQGYGLFDSRYGPGTPFAATVGGASYGIMFPCECSVNYALRRGRKIAESGMHNQSYGVTYSGAGGGATNVGLEDYSYNDGYSSDGTFVKYPALPVNFLNAGRFPTRARFAGQKIIGELVDSFRVFLTNDYKDVDAQLGEINNLRSKGDYVYYWQNHATGSMPILERILNSGAEGSVTSLGTGGVLSRFDTISTKYGNQHQWSLTDTEDGWIWFDMRNKDVCVMGFGSAVQEITVPTGMKSFFSEIFLERLTATYNDTYLNSQTYAASSDRPLMGTGIIGVYDPKNKMTYLTFKFRSYNNTGGPLYTDFQIISRDFTIGFSHVINKFVGFYDKMPAIWHNHNQSVLSANNPKNLNVYYGSNMYFPSPFAIGDVIKNGVKEYVCVAPATLNSYSNPPSASFFTEINTTNQIYIENEEKPYSTSINGYQYNLLYGRVVDNEVIFVVNPKTEQGFAIDNQLQVGNTVNFNQFYYNAETKSTSDTDVKSWNRNYQLIDEGWNHNLPISTSGKLSGFYNQVRYVKKNWLTNPTTIVTAVKILEKVKSFFKLKF